MRFAAGEDTRVALIARGFEFAAALLVLALAWRCCWGREPAWGLRGEAPPPGSQGRVGAGLGQFEQGFISGSRPEPGRRRFALPFGTRGGARRSPGDI